MASIGQVMLDIKLASDTAAVDVTYDVTFDKSDKGDHYFELCRIIGDDTSVGDPAAAGADDPLAYLAPLYYRETSSPGPQTLRRHFSRVVRKADLDEDYGPIPDADELRAVVTLSPFPPTKGKVVRRESNLVRATI